MTTIEITVSKSKVLTEVAKTTAYVGKKMGDDAYSRISTTDEDNIMLERFWVEACEMANSGLRHYISYAEPQEMSHGADLTKDYCILLRMPIGYEDALTVTVNNLMFSFFVNSILSKWFMLSNKDESAAYSTAAEGTLSQVVQLTYQRKRPTRTPANVIDNDEYTPSVDVPSGGNAIDGASQGDIPNAPTGPIGQQT